MTDQAIIVENLGKRFRIGGSAPYHRFSELISGLAMMPIHALRRRGRPTPPAAVQDDRQLWALRNVSFDVKQGEVLGVIGRNGAGKSTLLKLLSRITEPSEGFARVRGRVGSLLEVGTGFHPELTGRENIYLNGAILGMTTSEIRRKFDQIVDFAEIERFLDTPVKRYSSGMYMRLAFAVAAHLEPEILVIDEVLAVGDASFQKKCLGKMGEVARGGRTVLFVSHSMPAVQNLCHRALVLSQGQVSFLGDVPEAVQHYLSADEVAAGCVDLSQHPGRFGSGELRLLRFWLENEHGKPVNSVPSASRCALAVEYEAPDGQPRRDVSMSIHINTMLGSPVSLINTHILNQPFTRVEPHGIIRLHMPRLPLTAGRYVLDFNIATHGGHSYADFIKTAAAFEVTDGDFYGTGRPGNPGAPVTIDASWDIESTRPAAQGELSR